MSVQKKTFLSLWQWLLAESPEKLLYRVPSPQTSQVLPYRVSAFVKRSSRIANVFQNTLKIKARERLAVLGTLPNDYILILHGAWMVGVVPVIIPDDLNEAEMIKILKETNSTGVVFPPEMSARIASLIGRLPKIRHWIATGAASYNAGVGSVHRLDDLAIGADSDLPRVNISEDADAVIVFTRGFSKGRQGILFSQKALIEAGKAFASVYPDDSSTESLCWCGLSIRSFDGMVHSCLAPLFNDLVSYLASEVDLRRFWEFVYADDMKLAILDQEQMRVIHRKGKPRAWLKPEDFKILLHSASPLTMTLVASFEDRFLTPVFPCYSITEAGGIMTAMPKDSTQEYRYEWTAEFDIPSSGVPLADIDLRICSYTGNDLDQELLGEIRVKSARAMKDYIAGPNQTVKVDQEGYIQTGDEAYWIEGADQEKHIFVAGRTSDIIERNKERIYPARVNNALLDIRGIEYSVVLGFPNLSTGNEVGVFVIPLRASQLTEERVMAELRVALDWEECPKVVIFGSRKGDGSLPSRPEIEKLFLDYFDIDYSLGRYSN